MSGRAKRSGKIEFMRFVFSLVVIGLHINADLWDKQKNFGNFFSFFKQGAMGVEFFFLVSGYLMAMSAYKLQSSKNSISKDSIKFVFNKFIGILPMHLIAFTMTYLATIFGKHLSFAKSMTTFVKALPNLFLIQNTGIYAKNILGIEWYLSAMLIGMWIIFPFLLKNYKTFSRIAAPIIGLLLVGMMVKQTGQLAGVNDWMFGKTIIKSQLRAIAELCLGVFAFEVVRYMQNLNFTNKDRITLTVIEIITYCIALLYCVSQLGKKYQAYILFILLVAVILSFSEVTYGNRLFNNKSIYFLGKLSLPIYLCQNVFRYFVKYMMGDLSNIAKVFIIFLGTIILAIPVLFTGEKLKRLILEKANKMHSVKSES